MQQDLIATPVTRLVCSKCGHELDVAGKPPFSFVDCGQCNTRLAVPVMLGSFMLVEQMGSGGMGAVYRALDTALNRFVAIKVMKSALGEDANLVASFIREAQAAAALNHRNIVQIYSCGQENGQPYIVMELVTGGKMNRMFSKTEPMDEVKLLTIALDVAEGLKAANEVGLVHGDIKPENVLIDQGGTAKIVDFGLAQFVNAQKDRGEIWGTPYYISPERARGNKADHRSDIYSLGATMFHALSGAPPFDGETAVDVVLARLKHPPPNLHELRPDLQKETVDLIERMMAADPYLRYPNSASLKSDMQAALKTAKAARKEAGHKHAKKNTSSLVIAGIAALLLLGLGVVLISRYEAEKETPAAGVTRTAEPPPARSPEPRQPAEPEEVEITREEITGKDGVVRIHLRVRFFKPEEKQSLVEAAGWLAGDRPMEAARRLDALGRKLPRASVRQMWIPLLEALPYWAVDDARRATGALEVVTQFIVRQPEDHPAHMPQVLARELLGKMDAAAYEQRRESWPAWFDDLHHALAGTKAMSEGDPETARQHWDLYLARTRGEPAWVYAFQPAIRQWRNSLPALRDVLDHAERRIEEGRLDEVRASLEAFQADTPPFFHAAVTGVWSQLRERDHAQQSAAREKAGREHRVKVQQDLDRVDAALTEQSALVVRSRDFRRASLSIANLSSDMQTPEGRAAAQWARDLYDRLDQWKAFLIRSIEAQPFTRADGSDLGGDVISASTVGVRVTLDGRSFTTHPWDAIPVRTLFRMAEFYTADPRIPEGERAEALVSLAIFSLINGAFDPAQQYAQRALTLKPDLQSQVRRLAPGLLPAAKAE